ncbi:hypothetical protein NL493_28875 [Klebsiella pneumoniae]|nr:hypothetical protein [Klebsiella pneumoniae]
MDHGSGSAAVRTMQAAQQADRRPQCGGFATAQQVSDTTTLREQLQPIPIR